jgi:hypothetical protein
MSAPTTIFKWPIDEFSKVAARDDSVETLKSKNFIINGTKATFHLLLKPVSLLKRDYLSLYLVPQKLIETPQLTLSYTCWLENNCGQRIEKSCTF